MSLRLRMKYQYRNFMQIFYAIKFPAWATGQAMRYALTAIIGVLAVGYIFQINGLATSGYKIRNLENKIADLQSDTQRYESELAVYQSMSNIQKRLSQVDMVPATNIKYIKVTSEVAVANK